jgi:hypothetical protein
MDCSRARQIMYKLKLQREQFSQAVWQASNRDERTGCSDMLSDNDNDNDRSPTQKDSRVRELADSLKERRNTLVKQVELSHKLHQLGLGDSTSNTESTDHSSTSPSYSSHDSFGSLPLIRLIEEEDHENTLEQQPAGEEPDETRKFSYIRKLSVVQGRRINEGTANEEDGMAAQFQDENKVEEKQSKDIATEQHIQDTTDSEVEKESRSRMKAKRKVEDYLRSDKFLKLNETDRRKTVETSVDTTRTEIRRSCMSGDSSSKDYSTEASSLQGVHFGAAGEARLHELYGEEVDKMREQHLWSVNHYRSNRHGRKQKCLLVLKSQKVKNLLRNSNSSREMDDKSRKEILLRMKKDIEALGRKYEGFKPRLSRPQRPTIDGIVESNDVCCMQVSGVQRTEFL